MEESYQIILYPGNHWKKVKESEVILDKGWLKFYLPGLLLVFLAVMLGDFIFESEYGFLFNDTLIKASRRVVLLSLMVLAANMLIYETSRIFRVPVSYEDSRKIAAYSILPLVLIYTITGLFPFMDIIGILAFYSLFLVYSALHNLYGIELKKQLSYITILLSLLFIAYAIIALLLTKLTALIIY